MASLTLPYAKIPTGPTDDFNTPQITQKNAKITMVFETIFTSIMEAINLTKLQGPGVHTVLIPLMEHSYETPPWNPIY